MHSCELIELKKTKLGVCDRFQELKPNLLKYKDAEKLTLLVIVRRERNYNEVFTVSDNDTITFNVGLQEC